MTTNITVPRATVEQALEALEDKRDTVTSLMQVEDSITALRTALAQPSISQQVVDKQAEDEGLWFRAETASEAYLQQELRRLHAAVEGKK